jgi:uncharacterized membrane protein YgaE (UPF0421/DUF939 family)
VVRRPALDLRDLAGRRWEALRASLWRIAQAAVASALAWWLARQIPHHPRPFFAPIAAVIAMVAVPGTRGRQALDLILGVVIGIGVAALVILAAGTGTWQLGLAAALAMAGAIVLSGRPVILGQAAASAVLLVALHQPGAAPGRLLDALIGGGVAIAIAQILLPIDPLTLVREAARATTGELAAAADELAAALRGHDPDRARRALARVDAIDLRRLDEALAIARGVVRRAPRRRWERRAIEAYGSVAQELHAATADGRALASGALRALRDDEPVPPKAAEAAEALAAALHASAADEAEAAAGRARAAAEAVLDGAPSLGLSVFAHAVDALAAHAARAAAASSPEPGPGGGSTSARRRSG